MSDEGRAQHYRLSILGQTLRETLDEMKEAEMFDEEQCKLIYSHFERNLRSAIANTKHRVNIRGEISVYRHHDDIWDIVLKSMQLTIDKKILSVNNNTKIISVPPLPRLQEPPKDEKKRKKQTKNPNQPKQKKQKRR